MKIAIVSDTHGNVANLKKIVKWLNSQNIKLLLHAGDIGSPEYLKESLADFTGEFLGVFGNMDKDYKIKIEDYQKESKIKILQSIAEISVGNKEIAMSHFPDTARGLAETGKYDIVFYGHTHRPWQEKIGECELINPGEAAGQFYKPTFAIYDTKTGELELKILEKI